MKRLTQVLLAVIIALLPATAYAARFTSQSDLFEMTVPDGWVRVSDATMNAHPELLGWLSSDEWTGSFEIVTTRRALLAPAGMSELEPPFLYIEDITDSSGSLSMLYNLIFNSGVLQEMNGAIQDSLSEMEDSLKDEEGVKTATIDEVQLDQANRAILMSGSVQLETGDRLYLYAAVYFKPYAISSISLVTKKNEYRKYADVWSDMKASFRWTERAPFEDVASDHPNVEAIRSVKLQGIMTGYDNAHFGPDRVLTRAELLKIALRSTSTEVELNAPAEVTYKDVTNAHSLFPYISYAYHHNIATGYPDNTFKPDAAVTIAEAAKMILSVNEIEPQQPTGELTYNLNAGSDLIPYVYTATENSLLEPQNISGTDPMKRAQAAEFIHRMGPYRIIYMFSSALSGLMSGGFTEEQVTEEPYETPTFYTEVDVDDDAVMGSAQAPVTVVQFSDYECPYCKVFHDNTFGILKSQYIDTGKVRYAFRDFPLPNHLNAQKAAEATECAGDQGKFWQMHDAIFAHQDAITVSDLKKYAKDLGVNTVQFNNCLDSGEYEEEVSQDIADGLAIGVDATPTTYINGEILVGASPTEDFVTAIERALSN